MQDLFSTHTLARSREHFLSRDTYSQCATTPLDDFFAPLSPAIFWRRDTDLGCGTNSILRLAPNARAVLARVLKVRFLSVPDSICAIIGWLTPERRASAA